MNMEIDVNNPVCPHCQANLKEVGIGVKTSEIEWVNYSHEWYEPNGEWVSTRLKDNEAFNTTDDNHAYCGKCNKELSWQQVQSMVN